MRYLVLVGLIIGGLLGYYVLWSHMIDQVAAQANLWIEGQKRQGRDVGYESQRLWGFPYRLSLTLTKPRWSDPQNLSAPRLEADEITAHLQLWDLHHVIFDLPGRQRVTWLENNTERQVTVTSERFRASLVADGAGNWLRWAADMAKPQVAGSYGEWTADKLLLHTRRAGNVPPSLDLALQAENLMLPPSADTPLGRQIAQLKLIGNARGGSLYGRTLEEILASWRDGGGIIDLSTVSVNWGQLKIDGDGSVGLDKQFRPLGAMTGQIRGADAAVDALVASGRMRGQDAALAKTAFALLAKRDDKGQAYLQAPLTAQDGKLFLGPAALLNLQPVIQAQ